MPTPRILDNVSQRKSSIGFLFLSFMAVALMPSLAYGGAYFWDLLSNDSRVQRKWDSPKIRWRYNPSNAPADAQAIIQQAFQTWQTEGSSEVSAEYAGTTTNGSPKLDGYSDIFFNVSMGTLGAPSNIIALTLLNSSLNVRSASDGTIVEADILVNPDLMGLMTTTTSSDPTNLDLAEVLTHEIGHAYGLAHSFLIDSMMFPSKPPSDAPAELKNLFRAPKRDLSQDDIAWISMLYPPSNLEEVTAQISGRVQMGNSGYTGAHVIAIKTDDSTRSLVFYPQSSPANLVVKGVEAASAFSEENGEFKIKGLKPGTYRILSQDTSDFLSLSLANVNSYLNAFSNSEFFPLQFWQNPDCVSYSSLTSSTTEVSYSASSSFSVAANQGYCGIEILAHQGSGSTCGRQGNLQDRCDSGGGCSLQTHQAQDPSTYWLSIFGLLFALCLAGIRLSSIAKMPPTK